MTSETIIPRRWPRVHRATNAERTYSTRRRRWHRPAAGSSTGVWLNFPAWDTTRARCSRRRRRRRHCRPEPPVRRMRLVTMASIMALLAAPAAGADGQVERIVTRHVRSIVPPDGGGGAAVALRIEGRTLFFNYGWADRANKRPITTDTLFNLASLRKVFETTLLAQAVGNGEVRLDDPVAKYVAELDRDGDIGRVTLGQLATHTSGLLLPQDHPPWPDWGYTLPEFIRTLNAWKADKAPGQQHLYTHAGYVLLQLALERRYGASIDELIEQRLLRPLGMTSTTLPRQDDSARGRLSPEHKRRAVQG